MFCLKDPFDPVDQTVRFCALRRDELTEKLVIVLRSPYSHAYDRVRVISELANLFEMTNGVRNVSYFAIIVQLRLWQDNGML